MEKKRILVVDDEGDFTLTLKASLERSLRYEVMVLSDPKEIISKFSVFRPHLILLDLLMPTVGGIEVCEMLNNDPQGKHIPIIVISGLSKDIDKLKAYKVGVVDYLVKPVQIKDLSGAIEKALKFRGVSQS